jgi:hypothetical protein
LVQADVGGIHRVSVDQSLDLVKLTCESDPWTHALGTGERIAGSAPLCRTKEDECSNKVHEDSENSNDCLNKTHAM